MAIIGAQDSFAPEGLALEAVAVAILLSPLAAFVYC
jgi:hypothetical protein